MKHIMKCKLCSRTMYKTYSYKCCGKKDDICVLCYNTKCNSCIRQDHDKNDLKQRAPHKKQEYFRDHYKCSLCKDLISSFDEPFYDQNCGYTYCYPCVLQSYERYLRILGQLMEASQAKPQIGVDFDCGCEFEQSEIIKFIKKYCYICKKSLGTEETCQLNNNTKIMKRCYQKIQRNIELGLSNKDQKLLLNRIKKLLLNCSSCGELISELGTQEEGISICKACLKHSSIIESVYDTKKNKDARQKIVNMVQQKKQDRVNERQTCELRTQENSLVKKVIFRQKQQLKSANKVFQSQNDQLDNFQTKKIEKLHFTSKKEEKHESKDFFSAKPHLKEQQYQPSISRTKLCFLCASPFEVRQQGESAKICYDCLQKQLLIHKEKVSQSKPRNSVANGPNSLDRVDGSDASQKGLIAKAKALLPCKDSLQEINNIDIQPFKQVQNKEPVKSYQKVQLMQDYKALKIQYEKKMPEPSKVPQKDVDFEGSNVISIIDELEYCRQYLLQIDLDQRETTVLCCICAASLLINTAMKAYYRSEFDTTSLRVAQTQEEIEKYSSGERIKHYCPLCYFQLKIAKQNKLKAPIEVLRYSRSMPKKEPVSNLYLEKSNIFAKYERPSYAIARKQAYKPLKPERQSDKKEASYNDDVKNLLNKKMKISATTVQCKYCHREFQTEQNNKLNHVCAQCKIDYSAAPNLSHQEANLCRGCNQVTTAKDMQGGYCSGCDIRTTKKP